MQRTPLPAMPAHIQQAAATAAADHGSAHHTEKRPAPRSYYQRIREDLTKQRDSLLMQAQQLQTAHQTLLLEHRLVAGYCECLALLQLGCAAHELKHASAAADTCSQPQATQFTQLLQAEAQLLQQLDPCGSGAAPLPPHQAAAAGPAPAASASSAAAADSYDLGVHTISPPWDPMAFVRHLLSLPPVPAAETMTSQEIASVMRDTILRVSMELHLLRHAEDPAARSMAQQGIREAFVR